MGYFNINTNYFNVDLGERRYDPRIARPPSKPYETDQTKLRRRLGDIGKKSIRCTLPYSGNYNTHVRQLNIILKRLPEPTFIENVLIYFKTFFTIIVIFLTKMGYLLDDFGEFFTKWKKKNKERIDMEIKSMINVIKYIIITIATLALVNMGTMKFYNTSFLRPLITVNKPTPVKTIDVNKTEEIKTIPIKKVNQEENKTRMELENYLLQIEKEAEDNLVKRKVAIPIPETDTTRKIEMELKKVLDEMAKEKKHEVVLKKIIPSQKKITEELNITKKVKRKNAIKYRVKHNTKRKNAIKYKHKVKHNSKRMVKRIKQKYNKKQIDAIYSYFEKGK